MASQPSWYSLPAELVYHIFENLSAKDLTSAGRVCSFWHKLAEDEHLWKAATRRTLHDTMCNTNHAVTPSNSVRGSYGESSEAAFQQTWKEMTQYMHRYSTRRSIARQDEEDEERRQRRQEGENSNAELLDYDSTNGKTQDCTAGSKWKRFLRELSTEEQPPPPPSLLLYYLLQLWTLIVAIFSFVSNPWRVLSFVSGHPRATGIIMVGEHWAGKTSLIHRLTLGTVDKINPSNSPTLEVFKLDGRELKIYDLPGSAQRVWRDYYMGADGVIFVVDSSDPNLFDEVKHTLQVRVIDALPPLVPILVLGNKSDSPCAVSRLTLMLKLGIYRHKFDGRPIRVDLCSAVQGTGYQNGLRWLLEKTA